MLPLIKILFQVIATIITFVVIGSCIALLSLMFWTNKYADIFEDILKEIWSKQKSLK